MMFISTLLPSVFLGLLLALVSFPSFTNATAMTYNVAANEKACFYVMTDKPSKKIGFYFAVSFLFLPPFNFCIKTLFDM